MKHVFIIILIFFISCEEPTSNLFFNRTSNLLFKEQKFKIYQHPREIQLSHEIDVLSSEGTIEVVVYPRTKHFQAPHINYNHVQQFVYFEYDGVVNFEKIRDIEFTLNYFWKKTNPLHIMTNSHRDSIIDIINKTGKNIFGYTYIAELARDYTNIFTELDSFEGLRIEIRNFSKGETLWKPFDYKSVHKLANSIDSYKIRFIVPMYSGSPVMDGYAPPYARPFDQNVTTYTFPVVNFLVRY